jgi:malonate-semialdehyde dehydrogenase (acetylating) / methylmalonate-semialdehyde dehydrogenase
VEHVLHRQAPGGRLRFPRAAERPRGELAAIITAEHSKVLSDALGEINRGQEVVELATGFPHLIMGAFSESASAGIDVYSIKQPLGVVGIISPFNFPAMVPMWFFPIAIAAGNAVVLKPSEKDPSASLWLAQLRKEAGLPGGVFTVLQGDRLAVDGLLNSPVVQSISFVGSTLIAQYIYETVSKNGKRVQALGGAKNHMLVLPDADLDLVADQAVNAGCGAAGERCMAVSVVLAVAPVADELITKISERVARLRVGNGAGGDGSEPDLGPLISKQHTPSAAGRSRCSATPRPTACTASTSSPARRPSPAGGWIRPRTAASTWASPRTTSTSTTSSERYARHYGSAQRMVLPSWVPRP